MKIEFNSALEEEIRVSIYDLNGRELQADIFRTVEGINVFQLNIKEIMENTGRGIYVLRLATGEGLYSKKFVLE